ncbi:MAG: hypothetical protein ACFBZ9_10920 [Sphingomonadales bacterium]
MGKMLYGNDHFNRGKFVVIRGVRYFRLTTGKYRNSDPANRCRYSHYMDIRESDIKKRTRRGICSAGGRVWDVELKPGATLVAQNDYDDSTINSENTEHEIPQDGYCLVGTNGSRIPPNLRWVNMGNGILVWTTADGSENAISITFIPDTPETDEDEIEDDEE